MKIIAIVLSVLFPALAFSQTGRPTTPAYKDEPLQVQKELKAVAKKMTQTEIEAKIRADRANKRKPDSESDELANYIDKAEAANEESEE